MLLTFYFEDIWLWEVIPPEIVIFFHFFSIFIEPKKSLWFFSCYQYFQKLPLLLYLAILYFVFFCHVCSPLSELFISMLFSINPNRNIRSSSQIRQNSQVFHYSWFIAKWVHVLGISLAIWFRHFPHFVVEKNFLFKQVKVQFKIAKLLSRVIKEKLETVLQLLFIS